MEKGNDEVAGRYSRRRKGEMGEERREMRQETRNERREIRDGRQGTSENRG